MFNLNKSNIPENDTSVFEMIIDTSSPIYIKEFLLNLFVVLK